MADIELVIKIPETLKRITDEEDYKTFSHPVWQAILMDIIQNATPLPKGHGRLIDANVLADGFEDNYEFCEVVNATPTIIEADKGDEK